VLEPSFYIDFAEENIKNGDFPIMNMVFFGVFSDNEGATMNAYTYGLQVYGKKNIEVVNSSQPINEILDLQAFFQCHSTFIYPAWVHCSKNSCCMPARVGAGREEGLPPLQS
jgi:hypothetical protein